MNKLPVKIYLMREEFGSRELPFTAPNCLAVYGDRSVLEMYGHAPRRFLIACRPIDFSDYEAEYRQAREQILLNSQEREWVRKQIRHDGYIESEPEEINELYNWDRSSCSQARDNLAVSFYNRFVEDTIPLLEKEILAQAAEIGIPESEIILTRKPDPSELEPFIPASNFDIKKKIVESGNSEVFKYWHENAGISMEDFLAELKWLCEDPYKIFSRKCAKMTRQLGCTKDGELVRLFRVYARNADFLGFYRESNGERWSNIEGVTLSCQDRV